MNDNLPDINFKEKKEKKGGAIGWLRGKLGLGSRGSIGQAGVNPSAMNVGKAAFGGASKFGASAGLGSFLAGNAGLVATVAMVAVAGGLYLANNAPAPSTATSAFSSNQSHDNYVPAILRSQAANQGSSLDMFKDTNKGSLAMDEAPAAKKDQAADPNAAAADGEEGQPQDPNAQPDGNNMAQDMMGKLQGGEMASLTSQLGGGSNKFSNMGGFSNKFGSGATGAKTGFTSGIGAGFSSMPKFDNRKGKMLAMKGAARPVFGSSKAGKKGSIGAGAMNQAKGMRAIQKSFTGDTVDGARSTQDKAWEGTTGDDSATGGGAGISDGGAGIVSSPSLDNVDGMSGGGGTDVPDSSIPDASGNTDESPWADDLSKIMTYLMLSCILTFIASKVANILPWGRIVAIILAAIAALLALAAIVIAVKVMGSQALMGTMYLLGGIAAVAAAVMAITGAYNKTDINPNAMVLLAGAGALALISSMLGGK
ncbi:MAG: hypothetical protein CVU79_00720 [Elusimicrobia bacterium HGW-Elusimicrobia-3]|nr:MAG: hypothetical protein CVU79_00720 [Elusimicrobia bacterium HGW-Elusimicrobia-3]